MVALPTRDGATGAPVMRVMNGRPLNDDSRVYVCRKSRFSSLIDVTGPFAYRNVLAPRLSMFLNVQRRRACGLASPLLSTLMTYRASVAKGYKFGPPLGSENGC